MSEVDVISEELVRCRPCGYVMKKSDLEKVGVCPACGLPHTVFESYRERVSAKRLQLISLNLHPIAIHLSQTFVAFLPLLIALNIFAPNFLPETVVPVINFTVILFPLTLLAAFVSGVIDGLTRFKTLDTPLLKAKIIYSVLVLVTSIVLFVLFVKNPGHYNYLHLILSVLALVFAVKLGRMGEKLLNVILPGKYQRRKKKVVAKKS